MQSFSKYLNPLYYEIDKITDFANVVKDTQLLIEEYPYLEKIVDLSASNVNVKILQLQRLEKELEDQIAIIENETGDDKSGAVKIYNQILNKIYQLIDRANRELEIIDNPYFGKIVIDRKAHERFPAKRMTTYIGKFAVFNTETKEVLVTDWRAPIANVYYTNSGPTKNISFNSPIGTLYGDLLQKRQFEIQAGRIKHIYDAKSGNVSADEFLLAQLNRRIGKKLSEIVATIQEQQNEIIRDSINQPIILQGVAGSGKTTIVLHRLAYLFFTYPNEVDNSRSLIIAPNRMFLEYISNVLPSLGIKGVESNTYIFWAKSILGFSKEMTLSNVEEDLEIKKYKGSYEFILSLKNFFNDFEKQVLEQMPFSENHLIEKRYWELKKNFPKISFKERLNLAVEGTFQSTEVQYSLRNTSKQISDVTKERILKYVEDNTNVNNLYMQFINSKYVNKKVSDYTKKTYTRNTFASEDLPPLIWIHLILFGTDLYLMDYIVVDEAQDMSIFEIYTLRMISKKSNLFLAGDLAQSIIPPFNIKSWDQVTELLSNEFNDKIKYYQLNKCYRTTIEIIDYANNILKNYFPSTYKLPEAVLRHGNKVSKITTNELDKIILDEINNGSTTIALICKNENEATKLFESISPNDYGKPVYTYSDSDYKTGILVLPVSKAKGLEFDSVIMINSENYDLKKELDVRQFYVGVTRALHRLYIHTNE